MLGKRPLGKATLGSGPHVPDSTAASLNHTLSAVGRPGSVHGREYCPGCTNVPEKHQCPDRPQAALCTRSRCLCLENLRASRALVWLIFDEWFKCAFLLFSFCLWLPPFCSVTGCPCLFCVRRYVPGAPAAHSSLGLCPCSCVSGSDVWPPFI